MHAYLNMYIDNWDDWIDCNIKHVSWLFCCDHLGNFGLNNCCWQTIDVKMVFVGVCWVRTYNWLHWIKYKHSKKAKLKLHSYMQFEVFESEWLFINIIFLFLINTTTKHTHPNSIKSKTNSGVLEQYQLSTMQWMWKTLYWENHLIGVSFHSFNTKSY